MTATRTKVQAAIVGFAFIAGGLALAPAAAANNPHSILQGDGDGAFTPSSWKDTYSLLPEDYDNDVTWYHFEVQKCTIGEVHVIFDKGSFEREDLGIHSSVGGEDKENNPGLVLEVPSSWVLDREKSWAELTDCGDNNGNANGKVDTFNLSGMKPIDVDKDGDTNGVTENAFGSLGVTYGGELITGPLSYTETTKQELWQKTVQPVLQDTITPRQTCDWVRNVMTVSTGTLVSRLNWTDDIVKDLKKDTITSVTSKADNGDFALDKKNGKPNGFTFILVPPAGESARFEIAQATFNASGKKTSDDFNQGVGYFYDASVSEDGKTLTLTFDDMVASTSVHVEVQSGANSDAVLKSFAGNVGGHDSVTNGVYTVDLPAPAAGNSLFALVHFTGLTAYSGPADKKASYSESCTPGTDKVTTKWLRDEDVSEAAVLDEENDNAQVYKTINTREIDLTVTVTDTDGYEVTDLANLPAGDYTVTLTDADGKEIDSQTVTVDAGDEPTTVNFDVVADTEVIAPGKSYKNPPIHLDPIKDPAITKPVHTTNWYQAPWLPWNVG